MKISFYVTGNKIMNCDFNNDTPHLFMITLVASDYFRVSRTAAPFVRGYVLQENGALIASESHIIEKMLRKS